MFFFLSQSPSKGSFKSEIGLKNVLEINYVTHKIQTHLACRCIKMCVLIKYTFYKKFDKDMCLR